MARVRLIRPCCGMRTCATDWGDSRYVLDVGESGKASSSCKQMGTAQIRRHYLTAISDTTEMLPWLQGLAVEFHWWTPR